MIIYSILKSVPLIENVRQTGLFDYICWLRPSEECLWPLPRKKCSHIWGNQSYAIFFLYTDKLIRTYREKHSKLMSHQKFPRCQRNLNLFSALYFSTKGIWKLYRKFSERWMKIFWMPLINNLRLDIKVFFLQTSMYKDEKSWIP